MAESSAGKDASPRRAEETAVAVTSLTPENPLWKAAGEAYVKSTAAAAGVITAGAIANALGLFGSRLQNLDVIEWIFIPVFIVTMVLLVLAIGWAIDVVMRSRSRRSEKHEP